MRRGLVLAAIVCGLWNGACGSGQSPTAPSAIVVTPPAVGALNGPASRRAAIGPLSFSMPLVIGDSANAAFGLAPFGYHGADHAADGHAGWDIEYRAGGLVRATADGTVLSIAPDPAGRTTVEIEHSSGDHFYRTVYSNLSSVTDDVVVGEAIARGQVLGVAGSLALSVGNTPITYSMIHFQIDDFDFYAGGIPNPNAVSPELVLSADGRAVFDRVWPAAVFAQELTEPFATNPRAATFPLTRAWYLESGEGPVGISFTRRTARSGDYEFAILAASGTSLESGTVTLRYTPRPLQSIDLVAATSVRLGLYDIVDDRMRLAIAAPGAPRPVDLSAAAVYRTTRLQ
jgi:murein DD-endopeptidase MepM/ murein hydrolase activator NlpD